MMPTKMEPGECRWVGREDIHVYCMGSRVGGKYDARERVYKVWTADSKGSPWDREGWESLAAVGQKIQTLVKRSPRS